MLPLYAHLKRRVIVSGTRRIARQLAGFITGEPCPACGMRRKLLDREPKWPELIEQWELSPKWAALFYAREGKFCEWCDASLRCCQLAKAIVDALNSRLGTNAACLDSLFDDPRARALAVAEINSVGSLHRFLCRLPNLSYSEYGIETSDVASEDLMCLSYSDSSFDLILTSETLEHVPDIDIALNEIHRVLKPAGLHIFTVPIVMDRPETRQRASIRGGKLVHHAPPSYHGNGSGQQPDLLVFYEFGADFVERCRRAGFNVRLACSEANAALVVFITSRSV